MTGQSPQVEGRSRSDLGDQLGVVAAGALRRSEESFVVLVLKSFIYSDEGFAPLSSLLDTSMRFATVVPGLKD